MWRPNLAAQRGPRYTAIADALAEDIAKGRVLPGDRLPTHRDLADALGVTVGTVSRAYREAQNRGLLVGEVGRGTFVRTADAGPLAPSLHIREAGEPDLIDLSLNTMPMPDGVMLVGRALAELAVDPRSAALISDYAPQPGLAEHRHAAVAYLARFGIHVDAEQVLVTAGAQHAIAIALMGLTRPGDGVLAGRVTYPATIALCRTLHLRLHPVALDEHGLEPDALEEACKTHRPRVLYCMPNLQNPTGSLMPHERRLQVVDICRRHGVAIVEDDVYGFLLEPCPQPLCALWPDRGFYVTSFSKSVAPGLRVGYLVLPPGDQAPFLDALWSTTVMAPPLLAELATRWLRDGTAERLEHLRRDEAAARQVIAREILGELVAGAHPCAYQVWLPLPGRWQSGDFVARAMQRSVAVTPGEAFAVSRLAAPAIRIGLGAARSREQLRVGLQTIASLLHEASPQRVV
jgi:DNA-binding transcriptional MocR family regulator